MDHIAALCRMTVVTKVNIKTCSLAVAAAVVLGAATVRADVTSTYFLEPQATDFETPVSTNPSSA